MRFQRFLLIAFVVTVGFWVFFAWPLPRHVFSGIPAAAHIEPANVQPTIPGDHLQFMYYCWLAGDMLTGRTPLFYNLYEFNTGDERECYRPDAYYVPFSLIYALGAGLGGRAFGWNLTGIIALWVTYLLTWLLARRYTPSDWIAALAGVIGIALPFRWINLFGGSPAGFAMAWIPAILLGMDLAVREGRMAGGWLAGGAILCASWTDSHVFFFGTLAAPAWALVAFAARPDFEWKKPAAYGRLVLALLPVALLAAAALAFPLWMKWLAQTVTGAPPVDLSAGARTPREVTNYSPVWRGFIQWRVLDGRGRVMGLCDQIYVGWTLLACLAAGGLAVLWRSVKNWKAERRALWLLILLGLGILAVMLLALGMRGPRQGQWFLLMRDLIPPYRMIRQPAKIFCLLPTFFAVAAAIGLTALAGLGRNRAWRLGLPLVFALALALEYAGRVNPTISILEKKQAAYQAVAEDAAAPREAHALVLPLWPGDSHYASLYQYFASLYHVRMINGYNPFIKTNYFENVFRRFESVNQGLLFEDQVEALRQMGARYILLHEDLFPEKVSPFPVTFTLKQLLNNPRLELLRQDGSVWAFRILAEPKSRPPAATNWNLFFPARRFELEKSVAGRQTQTTPDPGAGGAGFATLAGAGAAVQTPPIRSAFQPELKWLVRARGAGGLVCAHVLGGRTNPAAPIAVESGDWAWREIPVPPFTGFAPISLRLTWSAGKVDLDTALFIDGAWRPPAPGEAMEIAAPLFFHAGHIDLDTDSVVFRARDPKAIVFYGPKLPLEKGVYEVELLYTSAAPPGTPLGMAQLEVNGAGTGDIPMQIVAGQPARGRVSLADNLPFNLAFVYFGNAEISVSKMVLTRIE